MTVSRAPLLQHRWRLRALSGAALLGYRAIWIMLFVAALLSTFYFSVRNELVVQARVRAFSAVGLLAFSDRSAQGQLAGPVGDEGRRLGYTWGDLVIDVDGHRIPQDPVAQTRLLTGADASPVVLRLRRSTGQNYSVRVLRDSRRLDAAYAGSGLPFEVRRWVQLLSGLIASAASIAAAALLCIRRPRDPIAQMLSLSLVLSCVFLQDFVAVPTTLEQAWEGFAYLLLVSALLLFPDGRLKTYWHSIALFLTAAGAVMTVAMTATSAQSVSAIALSVAGQCAVCLAVIVQLLRTPEGIARQQLKFVLFGVLTGFLLEAVSGLITMAESLVQSMGALAWMTLANVMFWSLGQVAIMAGLLVSLLKYRLYDAEKAISRSVVYGTLTLFLLAIFAGSEKVIEILGERYFGEHLGALAGGLGAAVAAVMVAPLHHRVTHWAEHRFQGDLVHLRQGLPLLVGDMRETSVPERLAGAVLARVETGVRASHGAVVTNGEVLEARDIDLATARAWLGRWHEPLDPEQRLYTDRDDPTFPLRLPLHADGVGLAGWLLLGPRPDGSFYGKDERETLMSVADPIARALAIAADRERSIGSISARMSRLETWLDEVRARLARMETKAV